MGDHPGALAAFRSYLRRDPNTEDREEVEEHVRALQAKLSERGVQQVTVITNPSGAIVFVDGQAKGFTPWTGELELGHHQFVVRRNGFEQGVRTLSLGPAEAEDVRFELTRVPAPPKAQGTEPEQHPLVGIRPLSWAALGVGVVGFGASLGFEFARAGAANEARQAVDPRRAADAAERANSHETTSHVFVTVGAAALLGAGVLLYLDAERERDSSTQMALGCGGSYCGVTAGGSF
jgi:hypothetical protein